MHSAILTDLNGIVLHYNPVAKRGIFKGSSQEAGKPLYEFLEGESKERLKNLLKKDSFKQPYFGKEFYVKECPKKYNLRFYTNPDHGFNLLFFEVPQVRQDVLLSQEEYRWLERLKLTLFGISHELKTPLATARGYTELLEGTDQEETGELIMDSLDCLRSVLLDMTKPLSNIDSEKKKVEVGNTSQLFSNMVPYMEPTKRFVGDFKVDFEYGEGKKVEMSKPRLYQMYNNLFENAMRAVEHKGEDGEIKIKARKCEKDHHFQCLVLDFSDNGVGMEEEVKNNIFAPYYTTRTLDSGTGLGGYFINQFVVDAGGIIDIDTELGEGTEFHIHLPYEEEE